MKYAQIPILSLIAALLLTGCANTAALNGGSTRIPVPKQLPPHPRFLLDAEEIAAIKLEAETDPWAEGIVSNIMASADSWDPASVSNACKGYVPGHEAMKLVDLGLAYQFTGDEKYARHAARALVEYADEAATRERTGLAGLMTSDALGEASTLIGFCWGYDLIVPAGVFTEAERLHVVEDLIDRTGWLAGHGCNHWNSSNWRLRAIVTITAAAFTTGNEELLEEALNGVYEEGNGYIRAWLYGIAQHISHSIRADGMYWETSPGYTQLNLHSLVLISEIARHGGVNLWTVELPRLQRLPMRSFQRDTGPPGIGRIPNAFEALMYRTFPNMTVARTGNARGTSIYPWNNGYDALYRQVPDPRFAWFIHRTRARDTSNPDPQKRPRNVWGLALSARDLPEGHFSFEDDVDIGSAGFNRNGCTLLSDSGYAIMRGNGDDVNATCFQTHYGRRENSHDHCDRLAATVYGLDDILAPDAGKSGYGKASQLDWMVQTIAHNTVTIDETSQYPQGDKDTIWVDSFPGKPLKGQLVFFHAGERFKAIRAICTNAYDGVELDRTLVLLDPFVLDVFRVSCERERQIDWAWHGYGEATSTAELQQGDGPLSGRKGYSMLTNHLSRVSGDDWDVTWKRGGTNMLMKQVGTAGTTHVLAVEPSQDGKPRTGVISRRKAAETVFVSVIEPYATESTLGDLRVTEDDHSILVELTHGDTVETVELALDWRDELSEGDGVSARYERTESGEAVATDRALRDEQPTPLGTQDVEPAVLGR